MFSMARQIPQATASMKAGKWEKKRFTGVELFNKTLGVVGLGAIGKQVAKRSLGLEMNVIAYDPYLSEENAKEMGIEKVELPALFARADFISFHTPITTETRNIVNKKTIEGMKDGVRILNCARGGIVNEADLCEALKSGKVAGAALDVFEKEPPGDNPLLNIDTLVCTPHLGASTEEAQENVAIAVAEQVADYLVNGVIRNAVNFPSVPSEQISRLKPYLTLAETLGAFATQVFEGAVTEITIEYRGEASDLNTAPVTIALLKGFLTPILEETVNFVNAPIIAKERGIEVREMKSADAGDYQSAIILRVKSDGKENFLVGTLLSRRDPRIVKINNFPVEIFPEGTMLFIYNNDKPGVIGNIGSFLGKCGINIARMHFGRETAGGMAISVVSIDAPITQEQLGEMKKLPNILSLKVVNL
jgi:D-3-phosphoglycerate dehydrogenase